MTVTGDGLTAGTHALTGIDSASLVRPQAADDAMLNINGIDITRTSNTISDAVDGVTLNLTKGTLASPGTAVLTVASDKSATTTAINSFVKAYNDVVKPAEDRYHPTAPPPRLRPCSPATERSARCNRS